MKSRILIIVWIVLIWDLMFASVSTWLLIIDPLNEFSCLWRVFWVAHHGLASKLPKLYAILMSSFLLQFHRSLALILWNASHSLSFPTKILSNWCNTPYCLTLFFLSSVFSSYANLTKSFWWRHNWHCFKSQFRFNSVIWKNWAGWQRRLLSINLLNTVCFTKCYFSTIGISNIWQFYFLRQPEISPLREKFVNHLRVGLAIEQLLLHA